MCRDQMKNRVLVIGLDGAEPSLLFKWASEGRLPNIASVMKEGVHGRLASTIPDNTAPAWTSFMTGKDPGKHGIFHFVRMKDYDLSVITAKDIKTTTLWRILSNSGKRIGVMNVPVTYPPEEVNGFMVSGIHGLPKHKSDFMYPRELSDILQKMGYNVSNPPPPKKGEEGRYLKELIRLEEKKFGGILQLMKSEPWDFFMTVFNSTDLVQHVFWKYMDPDHPSYNPSEDRLYSDAILSIYQKVDSFVGEMLKNVDENTYVIVMSDHGFGGLHKVVHLNKLFADLGFLKIRKKGVPRFAVKEKIYSWLVKTPLKSAIEAIPKGLRDKIPSKHEYSLSGIDFKLSKVLTIATHGFISINDPDNNEELRGHVIKELIRLKDPETMERIVERVYTKEELYSGRFQSEAPDLIAVTNPKYLIIGDSYPELFKKAGNTQDNLRSSRLSGFHRKDGILIMRGPKIRKEGEINARIIDLTPTILYLFDLHVPRDMDGRVLEKAFEKDILQRNPIQYDESRGEEVSQEFENVLTKKEEDKIKERLRDLGYIG
jgi:predicted AlkP superfamily phosphohydrolase/phosphomutase